VLNKLENAPNPKNKIIDKVIPAPKPICLTCKRE